MATPNIFISFAYGDPLSRLLSDVVADVVEECGFLSNRYRTADGGFQWTHYGRTYTESSLRAARTADLTVAVVLETFCGFIVPKDQYPDLADGRKMIGQLEYEEGCRGPGRHTFALRVRKTIVTPWSRGRNLPDPDKDGVDPAALQTAAEENLDAWLNLSGEDGAAKRESVESFNTQLQGREGNIDFTTVAELRTHLAKSLKEWFDDRPVPSQLLRENPNAVAQKCLADRLADLMQAPGWVVVTGGVGDGQDEAALAAAHRVNDGKRARRVLYVECDKKSDPTEVVKTLNAQSRLPAHNPDLKTPAEHVKEQLGLQRNVIVLIDPPLGVVNDLPRGKATVVLVTADARLQCTVKDGFEPTDAFGHEFLDATPLTNPASDAYLRATLGPRASQADAEREAFDAVVKRLDGWQLGLRTAANLIAADPLDKPVHRLLTRLEKFGVSALRRNDGQALSVLILNGLWDDERAALVPLAALPPEGFSARAATIALDLDETLVEDLLGRLYARSCLTRVGDQLWRLRREYRDYGTRQPEFAAANGAVAGRLRKAILPTDEARWTPAEVNDLLPDAGLALRLAADAILAEPWRWYQYQGGLVELARRTGRWEEVADLAAKLELARAGIDPDIRVNVLLELGRTSRFAGRWPDAEKHYRAALRALDGRPRLADRALTLTGLGTAVAQQYRHAEAVEHFEAALAIEHKLGGRARGTAVVQHALARSLWANGDRDRAWDALKASARHATEWDSPRHLSQVCATWAGFAADENRMDEALEQLDRAQAAAEKDRNEYQQAFVLWRRGAVLVRMNQLDAAHTATRAAVKMVAAINAPGLQVSILCTLADVLARTKVTENDVAQFAGLAAQERDTRRRLKLLVAALRVAAAGMRGGLTIEDVLVQLSREGTAAPPSDSQYMAVLWNQIGDIYRREGRFAEAVLAHDRALALCEKAGDRRGRTISRLLRSKAEAARDPAAAERALREDLAEPGLDTLGEAFIRHRLGVHLSRSGQYEEAEQELLTCKRIEEELAGPDGDAVRAAYPLHALGHLCINQRRPKDALDYLGQALRLEVSAGKAAGAAKVRHTMARAHFESGDFELADAEARRSFDEYDDRPHRCQVLVTWSRVLAAMNKPERAAEKLRQSMALAEGVSGLLRHLVRTQTRNALAERDAGHPQVAEAALRALLADVLRDGFLDEYLFAAQQLAAIVAAGAWARPDEAADILVAAYETGRDRADRLMHRWSLSRVLGDLAGLIARCPPPAGRVDPLGGILGQILGAPDGPVPEIASRFPLLWYEAILACAARWAAGRPPTGQPPTLKAFLDAQCGRLLADRQFDVLARVVQLRAGTIALTAGPRAAADQLAADLAELRAAKAGPTARFWVALRWARQLWRAGEEEAALGACRKAQGLAKRAAERGGGGRLLYLALTLRGEYELAAGRAHEGTRRLAKAAGMVLDAADHWAGLRLARAWRRADPREAVQFLRKLIDRIPRRERQVAAQVVCELARTLTDWGREWSAGRELEKALRQADLPADARGLLYYAQGELLRRQRRFAEAGGSFEAAAAEHKEGGRSRRQFAALRAAAAVQPRGTADGRRKALELADEAAAVVDAAQGPDRVWLRARLAAMHRRLRLSPDRGAAFADQAVREADELRDPRLKAVTRLTRSAIRYARMDSAAACTDLQEAVALTDETPADRTGRHARLALGRWLYQTDRRAPAVVAQLTRFLADAERFRYPPDEILDARLYLARALRSVGFLRPADRELGQAFQLIDLAAGQLPAERLAARRRAVRTEQTFVRLAGGRPAEALAELERLAQEWQWVGLPGVPTDNFIRQAHALAELRRPGEARARLAAAAPPPDANPRTATIYELEAVTVELVLGDLAKAAAHLDRAESLSAGVLDRRGRELCRVNVAVRRARIALAARRFADAATAAAAAAGSPDDLSCYSERLAAYEWLAAARLGGKDPAGAAAAARTGLRYEQDGLTDARLDPREYVSPRGIALRKLLAEALAAANDPTAEDAQDEAELFARRLDRRNVLIRRPTDDPAGTGLAAADVIPPAPARPVWEPGQQVLGRVVTVRQTGANNVEVELPDGTLAVCEAAEVFDGQPGNLARRFENDRWYPFDVLSADGQGVRLTQRRQYREAVRVWDGRTVTGTVRRTPDPAAITVELATGERLELRFPDDVGWGPNKAKVGVEIDGTELLVRLTVGPDGRLAGNSRGLYESAVQQLLRLGDKRPVYGEVVGRDARNVFVRLAPTVVATCRRDESTYDKELLPQDGDWIAVVATGMNGGVLTVSRKQALTRFYSAHGFRKLRGIIRTDKAGKDPWVWLGPTMYARLPNGAGPFADEQDVVVKLDGKPDRYLGRFPLKRVEPGTDGMWFETADPLGPPPPADALTPPVPPAATPAAAVPTPAVRRRLELTEYAGLPLQEFQREAMEAVMNGEDVIVYAPTGSGKTLVAEWAIERVLARNKRAVYTAPVKVLSNQKYRDFRDAGWGGHRVGLVTGDEERNPTAPVLVVTTEVFRNWAVERPARLADVDLLVLDELHYLDNESRGTAWEEAILFSPRGTQLLALSATVANADALANWLHRARGRPVKVIPDGHTRIDRPVRLVHRFVGLSPTGTWEPCAAARVAPQLLLRPADPVADRQSKYLRTRTLAVLGPLLTAEYLPVLYFCFEKRQCEILAASLRKAGTDLHAPELPGPQADGGGGASDRNNAVRRFEELADEHRVNATQREALRPLVERGYAYHHGGLSPGVREVVERLFEGGFLRLLFATDTFAVGVNMSVRTVVFDGLARGEGKKRRPLTGREYAQMAGRAGRMRNWGRPPDPDGKVFALVRQNQVTPDHLARYELGEVEPINSQFNPGYRTMLNIVCDRGLTPDEVWERTLAHHQNRADADRLKARMMGRLKVLEALGYIRPAGAAGGWELVAAGDPPPGLICSRVSGFEMYAAEAYRQGWLEEAEPRPLAMAFAAAACPAGVGLSKAGKAWEGGRLPPQWRQRLKDVHKLLTDEEARFGVAPPTRTPQKNFAVLAGAWYDGLPIDDVCRLSGDLEPGPLVVTMRVVVQGLAALAAALPPGHPGGPAVREALAELRRDELTTGQD